MTLKTLENIAKDNNLSITYKEFNGINNVMFIGNLAIGYNTIDDNGNYLFETDINKFPSSCTKKYIQDSIDAEEKDLGIIKKINWKNFKDKTFVIADIETTGFSPEKGGQIIEIGAIKIDENGNELESFHRYIKPTVKIPKKIEELTGVTNELVKNEQGMGTVLREFLNFFKGSTVVFHNAAFDWDRYLVPCYARLGFKIPSNYPYLDTKELSKYIFPNEKKHDLEICCERFNIEVKDHHSAFADVKMTVQIFLHLKELCKNKFEHLPYIVWNFTKQSNNIIIRNVRYWGIKGVRTGKHTKWRYYITFVCNGIGGSGFYDVMSDSWEIKEFDGTLDANELKEPVFQFLKITSYDELKKIGVEE